MPGARGDQAGSLRLEAQGAERPRSRGRRARAADPGGLRVEQGHLRRAEGAHGASATAPTVPLTPIAAARGGEGAFEAARVLCERDGFISSSTLSEYLGVTTRTAQRHIRRLLDDGLISEDPVHARSYIMK